jgi:hypothetical protein
MADSIIVLGQETGERLKDLVIALEATVESGFATSPLSAKGVAMRKTRGLSEDDASAASTGHPGPET